MGEHYGSLEARWVKNTNLQQAYWLLDWANAHLPLIQDKELVFVPSVHSISP